MSYIKYVAIILIMFILVLLRILLNRKSFHKTNCNNENCKNHNIKLYTTIRDNGGWDNWRMVCIEELGDVSKTQAHIKEEEWRQNLKANLNMIKAHTTYTERQEYMKEYNKEYRQQNKDKISENKKEYRQQNKDKIVEYLKEYRQQNKDKINEKITCECGCEIIKRTLARHKKSKKHQEWERQ